MNRIVYDSNFLIGLIDEEDRWHKISIEIHNRIKRNFNIIYLDCVANEVISVLARRYKEKNKLEIFREKVLKKFKEIIRKEDLTWIYRDIEEYYTEIIEKIENYSGRLNFNDCLIVIFLEENNIPYIASFDEDFDNVEGIKRIKDKKILEVREG
jgi:predicted nucleic acid-binding protein